MPRPVLPLRRLALVLPVLAVAALGWWLWSRPAQTENGWRTATVERGALRVAISATGSLRALASVDVGSQVSGQVQSVEVDFNDRVAAGQVIARLDPASFEARVQQARADLASARAQHNEAVANLRLAEADFARKQELVARQLIARSEFEQASASREQARARLGSAAAAVQQREAALASAELDLSRTVLRSPVDGVVLLRAVEPGQTVAASFQTPVLFQIAEDLSQMQIQLSIDESDVGQLREGQPVKFTVDAFPGREFRGSVKQVRLAAANTQNVVTYPVVVDVANPDGSLLPGLTANAEIEVDRRENVLRVPNAALRFRPADAPEEAPQRGFGGAGLLQELPALAARLELDAGQRAAFDADLAAQRERAAQRASAAPGGGAGGPPPGGMMMVMGGSGAAPSPEAIRQMVAKRMQENFAGFRAALRDEQRAAFDAGLLELLGGRRVTLWKLDGGKPVPVTVRAGLSDSSHTEVRGEGLAEGDAVIVGQTAAAR